MSDSVIRTATPSDFPGMLALLIAAFSDGQPNHPLFDQLMPETIRADKAILDNWYIAVQGQQVVASTQIVAQRFIVAPGVELRVGGIGQVSCLPGYRGKGMMSDLLNATIARMNADGYHVSILGGDRQRYRRYGWEVAGSVRNLSMGSRRISGKPVLPPENNRPVRWIGDERTIDLIHSAYQTNPSRILRTREETKLILQRLNVATWVHQRGDGFAYICLTGDRVAEYGGQVEAFEELLSFLLARRGLSSPLPAEEGSGPLEALMLQFAHNYSQSSVDMIRVFALKPLLEAYRPILERRLACWQGSLVLEMADDGEKVQISRDAAGLKISAGGGEADLKLDRPTWAPTLFGPFTPATAANDKVRAFIRQAFGLPIVWPLLSQI
jgi:predicted N-acetyltransferase YhbS